jgi:two-component system OmpR family sensor kinase
MDGFQARLKDSVQQRLSFALALAILAVAAVAGVISYSAAFDEANELQDDVLRQVAVLIERRQLPLDMAAAPTSADPAAEWPVIVQKLPSRQGGSSYTAGALALPAGLSDGVATRDVGGQGFRVLIRTLGNGDRMAVAQSTAVRDEIAGNGALRTVLPFLVLVPLLAILVNTVVRQIFRPIAALADDIDRRSESALHPFDAAGVPREVRPFVVAINRMLGRVAQSMETQRRFVADAAHELRSPLTAISLQAERLADTTMPEEAHARLATLRQGIARGRALLDQLLDLARAQASAEEGIAPIALDRVFRRVLEDLLPLAEAKQLDIGVEGGVDARVMASEADLVVLLKNLVENAIRYSPPGGRVDLSLRRSGGKVLLTVQDSGPGIPPAERDRVFAPFYRCPAQAQAGSGLGLSIVRAIAERLGLEVSLAAGTAQGVGLRVSVLLAAVD